MERKRHQRRKWCKQKVYKREWMVDNASKIKTSIYSAQLNVKVAVAIHRFSSSPFSFLFPLSSVVQWIEWTHRANDSDDSEMTTAKITQAILPICSLHFFLRATRNPQHSPHATAWLNSFRLCSFCVRAFFWLFSLPPIFMLRSLAQFFIFFYVLVLHSAPCVFDSDALFPQFTHHTSNWNRSFYWIDSLLSPDSLKNLLFHCYLLFSLLKFCWFHASRHFQIKSNSRTNSSSR